MDEETYFGRAVLREVDIDGWRLGVVTGDADVEPRTDDAARMTFRTLSHGCT